MTILLQPRPLAAAIAVLLFALPAFGADPKKSAAERAVMQAYRDYAEAYAHKDAAAVYQHCDPSFTETSTDGQSSPLAVSRQTLAESFNQLKSIQVTVEPEASEWVGDRFVIRYKQTLDMQFPLRSTPSTNWYIAEDVWQQKNGEWRRLSMKVITDKATEAKQRLEAQKKVIDIQEEQRKSRRCLNGLGYGCGLPQE